MIGLEINGTPYYYVRNLQGDVTKIIDGSGNVVVQYAYDSWGKILSVSGSLASTVGAKNPIRYRGYYYDTESELYYLNSRYYDPETGRFISPDAVAEGGNLYTYCANDPVNRSDDSGYLSAKWKLRLFKIAAGTVFAVGAVALAVMTGGAALSVIAPVVSGIIGGAALSGAISGTIALIQGNDGKEAMLDGFIDGYMWSGFFSAASATISSVVKTRSAVVKTSSAGKSVEPIQTGNVKVYHAIEGEKHYYGITNNLSRRAAEHARNGRTIIESLNGSYTRAEARGIEQFLINRGGGPKSLLLTNKINSIAPSNPNYIKMVNTGKSLFNTSCWVPFE